MSRPLPVVVIVTPSLADANNGNWRTAHRWQSLLNGRYEAIVQSQWSARLTQPGDVLLALHAGRSANSILQFRAQHANKPLIVALTGTDLYRDIADDTRVQTSLSLADALVVLQERGIAQLPLEYRNKTHVIFQSAKPLRAARKSVLGLNCVVAGHLRQEKDPETIFRLAEALPDGSPVRILHVGAPLDSELALRAKALSASNRYYHWSGSLPHGLTRAAIKRAHLLIHPSVMEGGANVIAEAISSGTPVIASHMDGNVGMLGRDYPGYFPVGDVTALGALLSRCIEDRNFLLRLGAACAARSKLFLPETERAGLCRMIDDLISR